LKLIFEYLKNYLSIGLLQNIKALRKSRKILNKLNVNLTKQQLIHSFHHNALELAGHITDTYILPSHLLKDPLFYLQYHSSQSVCFEMLSVLEKHLLAIVFQLFASTFSHFETRKQFYSILLEQEVLPDLQLRFPHRVIHTLLDGLNIHLLNISKKINSYVILF
jgi:hypothetical protein